MTASQGSKQAYPERNIHHGDTIKIGETLLEVSYSDRAKTYRVAPRASDSAEASPAEAAEASPWNFDLGANLINKVRELIDVARGGDRQLTAIKDYDLVRSLGKGGFGEVFLAKHRKTGNQVALKLMLPRVAASENNVARFLREIQTAAALDHPNLIRLLDAGNYQPLWHPDIFFFTMTYCNGGNLADLVEKNGGPLPIKLGVAIAQQMLTGLHHAHTTTIEVSDANGNPTRQTGIIHRDIKPHNVLLRQRSNGDLQIKIGDYGLAKAFDLAGLSGLTCTGNFAGTPLFTPRQQILDFKYAKPDVDVWATAATLYYTLTGTVPRNFDTKLDPFAAVLRNAPVPIRDRNSHIPASLAAVIDHALQEQPDIGFERAIAFSQALQAAMEESKL